MSHLNDFYEGRKVGRLHNRETKKAVNGIIIHCISNEYDCCIMADGKLNHTCLYFTHDRQAITVSSEFSTLSFSNNLQKAVRVFKHDLIAQQF